MIKTIFFDLGEVIVGVNHQRMFKKLSKLSRLPVKEIQDYYNNSKTRRLVESGKENKQRLYQDFNKDLMLNLSFGKFRKIYTDIFSLKKDTVEIIRKLSKNYELILLSNTDVIHFTEIKKRYSFLKYFDSIVLSYEARHRKPSPLIFYKAMKKTKSKPYECAYFDDVWQFVLVARLFGIKSMQFKGAFKLKKDLKKLGI